MSIVNKKYNEKADDQRGKPGSESERKKNETLL
jgi:hypothetical protein